jgi:3-oxoacid CoA-transferase subunit B
MPLRLSRDLIALRVARELRDGYCVNLGIGLPTMVSNFIPEDMEITLHAENGILGYGRIANEEEIDADLVNAGSQPLTLNPGASVFDSVAAFDMIRGGHIDLAVLGAFQVSEKGDLANWMTPERKVGSIGGAMDLVCGVRKVIVAMEHTTRRGEPRLVRECTYPLTARRAVNLVVTDLAVIEVTPEGLLLKEVAPAVTADEVQALTEPRLGIAADLHEMEL